jgi:outer membrane lipoprotein-sorting protein
MKSLDQILDSFGHSEPDPAAVQAAQRKLEERIAQVAPKRRSRSVGGWLAAAASAAAVVAAALWLPLASTTALAFSDVQKHFRDYDTMRFVVEQRMNGELAMRARVSLRKDGSVRTEVGEDVVVIVNSAERRVLTLLAPSRTAMVSPLAEAPTKDDSMEWMNEVREFQGTARLLPEVRTLKGREARGWELETSGVKIILWATPEGLPLEMDIDQGVHIDMSFDFEFNPTFAPETFSTAIPSGYTETPSED